MKILDGNELADYVKERQAKQVRNLRQAYGVNPKLVIIRSTNDPVITTYVNMKSRYGEDILVDVEVKHTLSSECGDLITQLNNDSSVHGIIIQLPIDDVSMTDKLLDSVDISKDVDGLASGSSFVPATAMAIDWLLNGYNVSIRDKKIAIVGHGKLVGQPLSRLWKGAGYDVTVFDEHSGSVEKKLRRFNLIVSAAGVPGLIKSQSLQPGAIIVDAATSSEHGKVVGDLEEDARLRNDLILTPKQGGVGPLTVAALFDNVIQAARQSADTV